MRARILPGAADQNARSARVWRGRSARLMMESTRNPRLLDKEQPRIEDTADETRHGGGDQPVQAAAGLHQEGEPGNADEHGGNRVGGEPLYVAGPLLITAVTSSPVQDEQASARDHGHREQLRTQGCRWLRSHEENRGQ